MKRNTVKVLAVVILCFLLSACGQEPPAVSDLGVVENEINTRFQISAPDGWNTFTIGDNIMMHVIDTSDEPIAFSGDHGSRIFMLNRDEWVELKNSRTYKSESVILQPSGGNALKSRAFDVLPVIPDAGKKVTLRIYLVGNVFRAGQGTDLRTAAYVDVQLRPRK